MLGINLKHSLVTVAVAFAVLAAAGPASAGTHQSGVIAYNGHAGLGAAVTDGTSNTIMFGERAAAPRGFSVDIGTSENIATGGLRSAPAHAGSLVRDLGKGTAVIDSIATKYTMFSPRQVGATKNELAIETIQSPAVFSADAYDNEMGLRGVRLLPDIDDQVL